MQRILLAAIMLALAACSGAERVQTATSTTAAPTAQDFGQLRVRYQVLPSETLDRTIAARYGVTPAASTAVILIGLRQLQAQDEQPITGVVAAQVVDLQGERQNIELREVRSGDYVDYVGNFRISPRNHYRFELSVDAAGTRGQLKFQRDF